MTKLRMLILLTTGLTLLAIRNHKPEMVKLESIQATPAVPAPVAVDPALAAEKKRIEALEAENLKAMHRENPDKNYLKYKSEKIAKFEKEIFETKQMLLRYENDTKSEQLKKMLKSNIIILQEKIKALQDE